MAKGQKRRKVTTKDIAEQLGIHHSTVSRALRGKLVSEEMIAKVRRTAKELGYRPNLGARIMVSGRTDMFGLLVSDPTNDHVARVVIAFQEEALRRGQHIVLGPYQQDITDLEKYMDFLVHERCADGLVVFPVYHPKIDTLIAPFAREVPLVLIGRSTEEGVHSVFIDYDTARRDMGEHLLELGHKRIAMILNIVGYPKNLERMKARRARSVRNLMVENGIDWPEKDLVVCCPTSMQDGYTKAKRLLAGPRRPTAIFCSNDILAMGVLRAAADSGLRVPEDLSVAGFGNSEWSQFFDLTTGDNRFDVVAETSLGMLRRAVDEGETVGTLSETVCPTLIVRGSTAPPPGDIKRRSRAKST